MADDNQKSLFGFKDMLPKTKVPISAERIKEAKAMFEKGDSKGSAEKLREVREGLERYCNRITNGK